jgi:hypothetical protein
MNTFLTARLHPFEPHEQVSIEPIGGGHRFGVRSCKVLGLYLERPQAKADR